MSRAIVITCTVCLVAAVAFGAISYSKGQQTSQDTFAPVIVAHRDLIAEVKISGTTKAEETADLAFKNGGIVDTVRATVGATVSTSTTLVTLRSNILRDQAAAAWANLAEQKARLRNLENGTRPEQIAVTNAALQSDETALGNTRQLLLNGLASAQSAADVAVRFTIDNFITNPTMSNSQFTIPVSDSTLNAKTLDERRQLQADLVSWGARIGTLQDASADDLLSASADMHTYLGEVSTILDDLTKILAMDNPAQFAADQTAVAGARTTITTSDAALAAAEQKVRDAQAAVGVTQRQLALEKAGAVSEVIAAQQAVVDSARAQVAQREDELKDQKITAPFRGIITSVAVKSGEAVSAGTPVVSIISNGQLKVEGYVPEVHYAEIAVGQNVRIHLDAFPNESFPGILGRIDPSATLRDGVPNFKVTVYFTNPDPRIRPGLTANADIQTAEKANALALPLAAVTGTGKDATVMRLVGSQAIRIPVVLGITSIDGYSEIISGLAAGDTVLVDETKQYRVVPN